MVARCAPDDYSAAHRSAKFLLLDEESLEVDNELALFSE